MKILDALEQKVDELLEETAALRVAKTDLERQLSESRRQREVNPEQNSAYQARIAELEKNLAAERKLKNLVLERVDALVLRLEGLAEARFNSAG